MNARSIGSSGLRWGTEQRLEFIESKLMWEGRINRGDIVEAFAVSVPQASADLRRYQEQAPDNFEYDSSLKCYVASSGFKPIYESSSLDSFLDRLLQEASEAADEVVGKGGFSVGRVPHAKRSLSVDTLKRLAHAVHFRLQLHVEYLSVSGGGESWRWIAPHAFGFDGSRWHVRAFCLRDQSFKDFVIARILHVNESEPSEVEPSQDLKWQQDLTLVMAPHPDLQGDQRRALLEYAGVAKSPFAQAAQGFHTFLLLA